MAGRAAAARRVRKRRLRVASVAALAALPAVAAVLLLAASPGMDPNTDLPDYARRDPRVAEAYHFAASDQGWVLQNMACYCGCGGHSEHDSNLACFVKPGAGGFDRHGSECQVCVDIALTAKEMYSSGTPLREIRTTIDARYTGYPATDTPMPA